MGFFSLVYLKVKNPLAPQLFLNHVSGRFHYTCRAGSMIAC